jgi:drug/metabolite transporter (DMT)-like permease
MWNQSFFTCLGILPLILWSTGTYAAKEMLENWGSFSGTGIVFLVSGALGLLILFFFEEWKVIEARKKNMMMSEHDDHISFDNTANSEYGSGKAEKVKNEPKVLEQENFGFQLTQLTHETVLVYFFLICNLCLYLTSLGLAPSTGDVLLHVVVINYLWVILINIGLVTILNYTFTNRNLFYFGITLGLLGIIISCIGFDFSHLNIGIYIVDYYYCYICSLFASLSWAGYTIYLKKYSHMLRDDHIFISIIIAGIIMTLLSLLSSDVNHFCCISFSFIDVGFFLYCVLFGNLLPYFFWDIGYKYGNAQMISNFAILTPFINVLSTSLFYGYDLLKGPIFGSLILIAAIICCRNGIVDPDLVSMKDNISTKNNPSYSIKNTSVKNSEKANTFETDVESDRLPVTRITSCLENNVPSSQKEGSCVGATTFGIEDSFYSSSSSKKSTRMSQRTTIMIECPPSTSIAFAVSSKKAVVEPPPSLSLPTSSHDDDAESQKPSTPLLSVNTFSQEMTK